MSSIADHLIALLTKPTLPKFMESVDDLVHQSKIKYSILKGAAEEEIGRNDPPGTTLRFSLSTGILYGTKFSF